MSELLSACACMGPIGNDRFCPCRMRREGLTPTEIWTPEAIEEFKAAIKIIADEEAETGKAMKGAQ